MNDVKKLGKQIGKEVKRLRLTQNITVKELSELCGLCEASLYKIEGGSANLTLHSVVSICNALHIEAQDFVAAAFENVQNS